MNTSKRRRIVTSLICIIVLALCIYLGTWEERPALLSLAVSPDGKQFATTCVVPRMSCGFYFGVRKCLEVWRLDSGGAYRIESQTLFSHRESGETIVCETDSMRGTLLYNHRGELYSIAAEGKITPIRGIDASGSAILIARFAGESSDQALLWGRDAVYLARINDGYTIWKFVPTADRVVLGVNYTRAPLHIAIVTAKKYAYRDTKVDDVQIDCWDPVVNECISSRGISSIALATDPFAHKFATFVVSPSGKWIATVEEYTRNITPINIYGDETSPIRISDMAVSILKAVSDRDVLICGERSGESARIGLFDVNEKSFRWAIGIPLSKHPVDFELCSIDEKGEVAVFATKFGRDVDVWDLNGDSPQLRFEVRLDGTLPSK